MDPNTSLLVMLAAISINGNSSATNKGLDAYMKYTGDDKRLNIDLKNIENLMPNKAKIYLGVTAFFIKTMKDKNISFTWHF